MRTTRRLLLASCWLIGLCWAASCGDDEQSTDALDGRMFVLESSQGFEPVAGTTVRLSFHDGSLSMHADCNSHTGDYAVQDGILIFESVGSTEIGCDPPLQNQDVLLVDFLTSKPQLHLDEDRLTLTSPKIALVFLDRETAEPDRPLVGTVWEVDTFIEGDAASSLPLATQPTIVFAEDGALQVDTTCNTGSGRYKLDGNRIMLSDVSYTDAACTGSSAAADSRTQAVLRDGTLAFEIEGKRLTLDRGSAGVAALARE